MMVGSATGINANSYIPKRVPTSAPRARSAYNGIVRIFTLSLALDLARTEKSAPTSLVCVYIHQNEPDCSARWEPIVVIFRAH